MTKPYTYVTLLMELVSVLQDGKVLLAPLTLMNVLMLKQLVVTMPTVITSKAALSVVVMMDSIELLPHIFVKVNYNIIPLDNTMFLNFTNTTISFGIPWISKSL